MRVYAHSLIAVLLCLPLLAALSRPVAAQSPEITIAAGTSPVTEGTAVTFTLTASTAPTADLTINLSVTDAPNSDFVAAADEGAGKTETISMGATSMTYSVDTSADGVDEPDGPVTVTVTMGTGYTVGSPSSASVTVNDDVPEANFAARSSTLAESAGTLNIGVTFSPAPQAGFTLEYGDGGTATAGADYVKPSGSLSVASGATSANIAVSVTQDLIDDDNETIILALTSGTGYTIGSTSVHTVSIQDDDEAGVTVSRVNDNIVLDEGGATQSYTVALDTEPTANVTVTGTVKHSSALAVHKADDAPGSSVALTFAPTDWNQPQTVTMTALEDNNETDEVTRIDHVATGVNEYANVEVDSLVVSVNDNDLNTARMVTVLVGQRRSVPEGRTAAFNVQVSPGPTADLTVNLSVADAPNSDFVAAADEGAGKTFTVPANKVGAVYQIFLTADDVDEPDGPVTLTVEAGDSYTVGSPRSGSVIVRDDDPTLVTFGVTDSRATEGSDTETASFLMSTGRPLVAGEVLVVPLIFSGGVLNADFTVEFDGVAPAGVSFDWIPMAWSTVTFTGPAAREANFVLKALADGDATDDALEISIPASSSEGNPRLTATNLGGGAKDVRPHRWSITVTDDDASGAPGIVESAGRLNLLEGAAASGYTLRLRSAPAAAVTVTATSGNPSALKVHAHGGAPGASATLTFSPTDWDQPQAVTVTPQDDADADDVLLEISHTVTGTGDYASLSPDPITVFIADDEGDTRPPPVVPPPVVPPPVVPPPVTPPTGPTATEVTLSASPNPATEGETITVTATLSQSLASDVTIPLVLTAGTAEADDYEPLASIAIAANQSSGAGAVATNADDDADDETLAVALGELPDGVQAGEPSSVELTIKEPGSATFAERGEEIPEALVLGQNYPNPFNSSTTISVSLDKAQRMRLVVYDLLGQEVRVLVDGVRPAARYDIDFDASNLSSGSYFYVLQTENSVHVKSMSLIK